MLAYPIHPRANLPWAHDSDSRLMNWLSLDSSRDEMKGLTVKSLYRQNRLCWRRMHSLPRMFW